MCLRQVNAGQVVFAWPLVITGQRAGGWLAAQLPGVVGMVPTGYPHDMNKVIEQGLLRQWELEPYAWQRTCVLHHLVPGAAWQASVWWDAATGAYMRTYVDFQEPLRESGDNFDTRDLQLDLVVTPEGEWSWKDEDHYGHIIQLGMISEDHQLAVHRAREEVVSLVEAKTFPFDGQLKDDRPAGHVLPELPAGWRQVNYEGVQTSDES